MGIRAASKRGISWNRVQYQLPILYEEFARFVTNKKSTLQYKVKGVLLTHGN